MSRRLKVLSLVLGVLILMFGIKPPVIPGFVLLLGLLAVWDAWKAFGAE